MGQWSDTGDSRNDRGQFAGVIVGRTGAVYFSEEGKGIVSLVQAFGPTGCYPVARAAEVCADLRVSGLTEASVLLVQDAVPKTIYLWQDFRTSRVRLDTPNWTVDQVHAINTSGLIVGHGSNTTTG